MNMGIEYAGAIRDLWVPGLRQLLQTGRQQTEREER